MAGFLMGPVAGWTVSVDRDDVHPCSVLHSAFTLHVATRRRKTCTYTAHPCSCVGRPSHIVVCDPLQAHTDGVYTVGRIGLSLLVMEGGLGIDVTRFKQTWKLTTNLALTGTILPCLLGWGLLSIFGYGTLEGFAAGTVRVFCLFLILFFLQMRCGGDGMRCITRQCVCDVVGCGR